MKRIISNCLLLCMIMIAILTAFSCRPVVAAAEEPEVYYGEAYNDLKSEDQRIAYRLVEEGIASLAPRIEFEGVVQINYKQMQDVLQAVCVDHPQYFWFLETGSFIYGDVNKGGHIVSFDPTYILDGQEVAVGSQELADAMYAFHTKVQEIIHSIPANLTTEYEIALYLHDYLSNLVTYTLEGEHPSAYAALVHGEAACYGYSKAYQCLLNAAGIRSRTITGDCPDENGQLVGHAWNQVWLGEDCYYVDVTWDDLEEVVLHSYFMIPLEKMADDHFAAREFVLPDCTHAPIDPYAISYGQGIAYANYSTTAQQIAPCFYQSAHLENNAAFVCEIRYDGDNFLDWMRWVSRDLLKLLGLSSSTEIWYYHLSDAYYVQFVDSHYMINNPAVTEITLRETSISLIGFGRQYQLKPQIKTESTWTPNLTYTTSDASVAAVDERGMITSVGEGIAVITASSPDGSVQVNCTVTVEAAPAHVHSMRYFISKEPTCVQDGYESHYLCTGCGIRFADDAGTQALLKTADFIFPATGHLEYSWEKALNYHIYKCACGYEKPNTKANHTDADGNGTCDVCEGLMPSLESGEAGQSQNKNANAGSKKLASWVIPTVVGIAVVVAVIVIVIIRHRRKDREIKPFGG